MMKRFLFITICLCLLLTSFISTSVAASFPDPNSEFYELNDNSNMSASFMENLGEANRAYNALLASFRSSYNSNGTINISTAGYVDVAQGSTVFEQGAMVLWLKYHDGYSLREIAKMMGITLAWAQKMDQRAKKRLAELYREGGGSL